MRSGRVLLAAFALGGVVVACAGCGGGGAAAAPVTPAVPTIAGDPLDMTHAAGAPCTLARPDQLAQFRLSATGSAVDMAAAPGLTVAGCGWTPTTAGLPGYQAGVDEHSGLAALYRSRGRMAVFQPTTVSEYPAVHTATDRSALTHGQCTVDVGVANDTLVVVRVTVPDPTSLDYPDPCPDADSFAATVIADAEGQAP